MNKNQLFKKIPPIDLFERLVKIYGLTDINDCRKFTKDHLTKNKTLEKMVKKMINQFTKFVKFLD